MAENTEQPTDLAPALPLADASEPVIVAAEVAAAPESVIAEPTAVDADAPVEIAAAPVEAPKPAKVGRPRKLAVPVAEAVSAPAAKVAPVKPARKASVKAAKVAAAAPAKAAPAKAAPAKAGRRPATRPVGRPLGRKAKPVKTVTTKTLKPVTIVQNTTGAGMPSLSQLKEKLMAKTTPTDFTATIQTVVGEIQTKAKSAYEKGTAAFTEANDFAKGNVEALVESGKILASGVQELGTTIAADTRSAFETMTAEVKELAAVKSPTDFFQLQSSFMRSHFDGAVAQASKNTEAMMKLASEVISPLSSRVTLAVEKVSKAA